MKDEQIRSNLARRRWPVVLTVYCGQCGAKTGFEVAAVAGTEVLHGALRGKPAGLLKVVALSNRRLRGTGRTHGELAIGELVSLVGAVMEPIVSWCDREHPVLIESEPIASARAAGRSSYGAPPPPPGRYSV